MRQQDQRASTITASTLFVISLILIVSSLLTLFELSQSFRFGRYSSLYGLIMLILGIGCIGAAINFAYKGEVDLSRFKPNISLKKSTITTIILFFSIAMYKSGQVLYDRYMDSQIKLSSTQHVSQMETTIPHISGLERQHPGWGVFESSRFELSLLSPGPFERVTPNLPDKDLKIIKEHSYIYEGYAYKSDMMTITLAWIYFDSSIEPSLQETMDSTLIGLGSHAKLMNKVVKPVIISTLDGLLVDANYKTEHSRGAFKGVVLSKDSRVWTAFINYPYNDDRMEKIADRIINSIEFDDITSRSKNLLNLDKLKR